MWPGFATALIDLRNGNYYVEFYDLKDDETDENKGFQLRRNYNSRCDFQGMFGYGWSTKFDLFLNWENGVLVFHQGCGASSQYQISPDSLLTLAKLGIKAAEISQPSIINSGRLLGKPIKFIGDGSNGAPSLLELSERGFVSERLGIAFDLSGRLTKLDENVLRRNPQGELLEIQNTAKKFTLKFSRISALRMTVEYSKAPEKPLLYEFDKAGNLISNTNIWESKYRFDYDEWHNLTNITWPDAKTVTLLYDKRRDWVTMFKDRSNCVEQYIYTFANDDDYSSEVIKTCDGEVTNHSNWVFRHSKNSEGKKYLKELESSIQKSGGKIETKTYLYNDQEQFVKLINNSSRTTDDVRFESSHEKFLAFIDNFKKVDGTPLLYVPSVVHGRITAVYVLAKGGVPKNLVAKSKYFEEYVKNQDSYDKKFQGYFSLYDYFLVSDNESDFSKNNSDGISMKGRKLKEIRFKDQFYKITYDEKSQDILISGSGISKPESMTSLILNHPESVVQRVKNALDFGLTSQTICIDLTSLVNENK
jgi:YD repeat-containing protein